MVGSEYTYCPMCGCEDGQGCSKDCPSEVMPRLLAENAKLRAALEPFVKEALHWESCEDAEPLVEAFPGYEGELIVGDLRRARAALASEEVQG